MTLAFVTPAELRVRTQNAGLDDATAQAAIDGAVGLVRSVSGQDLVLTARTVELAGGGQRLLLPQRPVSPSVPVLVSELDFAGNATPYPEGVYWYRQGDVLVRSWPGATWPGQYFSSLTYVTRLGWPGTADAIWGPRVRVGYTSGYASDADLPAGLKSIILGLAQQLVTNPGMLREEQVGGVRLQYALESVGGSSLASLRRDLQLLGLRRGGAFSVGG